MLRPSQEKPHTDHFRSVRRLEPQSLKLNCVQTDEVWMAFPVPILQMGKLRLALGLLLALRFCFSH